MDSVVLQSCQLWPKIKSPNVFVAELGWGCRGDFGWVLGTLSRIDIAENKLGIFNSYKQYDGKLVTENKLSNILSNEHELGNVEVNEEGLGNEQELDNEQELGNEEVEVEIGNDQGFNFVAFDIHSRRRGLWKCLQENAHVH